MKKRIIAIVALLAVFGLAVAAFAYAQTSSGTSEKVSCCKNHDSCPTKAGHKAEGMKEHQADAAKSHESCPMKAKHTSDTAKPAGHSCCDCCGDSCPMKKDGAAASTAPSADNKTGCDCDCCKAKHGVAV